jgi:uncharacterized protein YndB with AHSA1/START domain
MKNSLAVSTPSDLEIVITRHFDAPRALVWEAMSNPEFIRRWLFGPPGWTMTTCDDDLRVGGAFHWGWDGPDGQKMSMRGTYSEVVPPVPAGGGGRMVRTETFEIGCLAQAGEQHCTLTLTDLGTNKTALKIIVKYPSKQARDGALASGMEHGMAAGYDRLEELLGSGF